MQRLFRRKHMQRLRINFSKSSVLRFTSHLDLQRIFIRMLRKSNLPLKYSDGFNPHILLSFALPLPLGMTSENEYAEVILLEQADNGEVSSVLQQNAPNGITIKQTFHTDKKAASIITAADYELLADIQEDKITNLLESDSLFVEKKSKKGFKQQDIRQDIITLNKNGNTYMRLSAGGERSLNPVLVMKLLTENPCPTKIVRKNLLTTNEGVFETL